MPLTEHSCRPQRVVLGKPFLRVYLVRHAESKKNVVHFPGTPEEQLDTLTAKGREQAAAIGKYLKDKGIFAVQSSPTGRTNETAYIIGKILGLKDGYQIVEAWTPLRGGR